MENNHVIFNKREAAKYLGVTTRHLERQISLGLLKAYKPSKKLVRIYRHDIDAYLQSFPAK